MRPTLAALDQYGLQSTGARGIQPWRRRQPYETFKSKFGPQVATNPYKFGQYDINYIRRIGPIAAAFGVSAGIFAVFFFDGVPRVQKDILQKIPFVGSFFTHEVAPEDNPF